LTRWAFQPFYFLSPPSLPIVTGNSLILFFLESGFLFSLREKLPPVALSSPTFRRFLGGTAILMGSPFIHAQGFAVLPRVLAVGSDSGPSPPFRPGPAP